MSERSSRPAFTSRVPSFDEHWLYLIDDLEVGENLPRRKLFDFLLVQAVEPIKERPLVRRQFRMLFRAMHGDSPCFGSCFVAPTRFLEHLGTAAQQSKMALVPHSSSRLL